MPFDFKTVLLVIWAITCAAFIVGEIFTSGFGLVCFAVGAAAAIAANLIDKTGFIWELAAFFVFSGAAFLATRPLAKKLNEKSQGNIGATRLVGVKAYVITAIDNARSKGQIKVEGEIWLARSSDDSQIAEGSEVIIDHIDGTKCIVHPVDKES